MTKSFKEALKARRTFYQIENKSTLSDKEIRDLIRFAVEFVPSAFNSQTTRVALLTGKAHEKLWNIVKNVLRKRVPAEVFGKTEEKIDEYKTMGAKMAKAGINTILSMAIVFCVLIFISLIIACFKVIGWAQNRKNAKQVDKAKAQLASVETAPQPVEENLVDDLELVAVITAAIAASENASADGLVVRSIIRR